MLTKKIILFKLMLLMHLGMWAGSTSPDNPDVWAYSGFSSTWIADKGISRGITIFEEEGRRAAQRYSRRHVVSSFRRTANNTPQEVHKDVCAVAIYHGPNPEQACVVSVMGLSKGAYPIFCPALHACYTALYLRHLF